VLLQRDRLATRVRNLVTDLHRRVVEFLTTSFDVVFLPKFESATMVRKQRRPFGSDVARSLLTWCHREFRQRLEEKAVLTGCRVLAVTERNSTRTCSCCGAVNPAVGASKVFHCLNSACRAVVHRDTNAAKNVFVFNAHLLPKGSIRLYARVQLS
jgi:putative transposase